MKVIIAGGREVKDYGLVVKAMENADLLMGITPTIVFSGRARGVDKMGEDWAKQRGVPVQPFPAIWRDSDGVYDPRAGHRRNTEMALQADALVAVWDGLSTGTADMVKKAHKRGLLVWVEPATSSKHLLRTLEAQLLGR